MSCSPLRKVSRRNALKLGAGTVCAALAASPSIARAAPLRFGLTPVFLTSDLELLGRLQSYMQRVTGRAVTLVTRRTYQEVTALLTSGQIDGAWICGFPFVAHRSELRLVGVPVWNGRPLYRSYLICDASRDADGLEQLRGDIHAFSDPDSNSGFLVTRASLAERALRPETFFSRTLFTYGHRDVIRAVSSGLAQSGSVDGYVYDVISRSEPQLTRGTRIASASDWYGFPPIAAPSGAANSEQVRLLRTAVLEMHLHDDGLLVLGMLQLDRFAEQPSSLFDTIAERVALVAATER